MIQTFHSCGMLELWLKPLVGQPPALLYSVIAQIATSATVATAHQEPTPALDLLEREFAKRCPINDWQLRLTERWPLVAGLQGCHGDPPS